MKKQLLFIVFLCPLIIFAQQTIGIIPKPVNLKTTGGDFAINGGTSLKYNPADKDLQAAAAFFSAYIKNISGYSLKRQTAGVNSIVLEIKPITGLGDEGYKLSVTPSKTVISATAKAGIIYGMQTIFQTLPAVRTNAALDVPCMEVTDYPRFKWRGMMLDVSRHFYSVEMVKEYLDLMSAYKMNVFHWHLVDDPGWRIEIKKYPQLTQVGAWRVDRTSRTWGEAEPAKPGEKPTYGGYYTQDQIRDIIKYAAERSITIVPEIEMPGHSAAAIASYPYLSCLQEPQSPVTEGNYTNISSNYCAGNDSVFIFLQNVLAEIIDLFPSAYIHIGGDEVDKEPWKKCARCQARIKKLGLKNEEELQSYFIKRIEKYVVSKNRKIIGWDEILEGGLAPEAAVMSWRGEDGGTQAAQMKHFVVMTPGEPCYFDHYQVKPETREPLAIGGYNSIKAVYTYEPVPKALNEDESKYVMGSAGNVWTEYIKSREHLEYMILPRMLALSEVLWSPKESRNWDDFNSRLPYQFRTFDQKGFHYCSTDSVVQYHLQ
jgi:hexosaminidase